MRVFGPPRPCAKHWEAFTFKIGDRITFDGACGKVVATIISTGWTCVTIRKDDGEEYPVGVDYVVKHFKPA